MDFITDEVTQMSGKNIFQQTCCYGSLFLSTNFSIYLSVWLSVYGEKSKNDKE